MSDWFTIEIVSNVKLTLFLIKFFLAMKTYGGVEARLYTYLTSVLNRNFTLWLLYIWRQLPTQPTLHDAVQFLIWR